MGSCFNFTRVSIAALVAASVSVSLAQTAFAAEDAVAAPEVQPPAPKPVTVVLRADGRNATLQRETSVQSYVGLPIKDASLVSLGTWEPACVAPCTVKVDPRFTYRVGGDGLVPSDSFTVPQDADHLRVDATMGSAEGRLGGAVLAVGGVGGILLGGAAMIAVPIMESQNAGSQGLHVGVLSGGAAVASVGVIALVSGIWLWMRNDTTLREDSSPRAAARSTSVSVSPSGVVF